MLAVDWQAEDAETQGAAVTVELVLFLVTVAHFFCVVRYARVARDYAGLRVLHLGLLLVVASCQGFEAHGADGFAEILVKGFLVQVYS